jgi:excisionase family DNA binding protein
MNKFFKVKEVAEILGISRAKVYELVTLRKIPFVKFGKVGDRSGIRFAPEHIEKFIKDRTIDSRSKIHN